MEDTAEEISSKEAAIDPVAVLLFQTPETPR
jgi:hypothetical protein